MKAKATFAYSDEDNAPMIDNTHPEYTGVINDKLFKETGIFVVEKRRMEEEDNGN